MHEINQGLIINNAKIIGRAGPGCEVEITHQRALSRYMSNRNINNFIVTNPNLNPNLFRLFIYRERAIKAGINTRNPCMHRTS